MTATVVPAGAVARAGTGPATVAEPVRRDAPGRPRLRLADELVRNRRRVRAVVALGAVVGALSLFLLVAFSVFVVQGQFTLERIEAQRELEQRRYQTLREEVAQQSSPATVVERARALGLVEPGDVGLVEAPAAAPSGDELDRTSSTLAGWDEVKSSLVAAP